VLSYSKPNGFVASYDPKTKEVNILKDNLVFANGVQVDEEEKFLVVSDLGRMRLLKVIIKLAIKTLIMLSKGSPRRKKSGSLCQTYSRLHR